MTHEGDSYKYTDITTAGRRCELIQEALHTHTYNRIHTMYWHDVRM